jgi:hypothetical protein
VDRAARPSFPAARSTNHADAADFVPQAGNSDRHTEASRDKLCTASLTRPTLVPIIGPLRLTVYGRRLKDDTGPVTSPCCPSTTDGDLALRTTDLGSL